MNLDTQNNLETSTVNESERQENLFIERKYDITIGDSHKYQRKLFLLLFLQWMTLTSVIIAPAFIFKPPLFVCNGKECTEDEGGDLAQTLPYLGSLIGMIVFSLISDNYGRKLASWISYVFCIVGIFGMAVSKSLGLIFFFELFSGCGIFSTFIIHFILLSESCGSLYRQKCTIGLMFAFSLAQFIFIFFAYVISSWRVLLICTVVVPSVFLAIGPYFYFESPKFLALKNKLKAIATLNLIAKINEKEPVPEDWQKEFMKFEENEKTKKYYTFWDLIKYKSVRVISICTSILFVTIQICYYGSEFALANVGNNIYVSGMFVALAENLAYICSFFIINKYPRKTIMFLFVVFTTIVSLCFHFAVLDAECKEPGVSCPEKNAQIFLACLARFLNAVVYSFVFVYFPEIFPTSVRSVGMGLSKRVSASPMVILGFIDCIGIVPIFFLPESFGKPIPDEIEEIKREKEKVLELAKNEEN